MSNGKFDCELNLGCGWKFFAALLDEAFSAIGNACREAAKYVWMKTQQFGAAVGEVVAAGAKALTDVGESIKDGIASGISALSNALMNNAQIRSFVTGNKDWADCGHNP